MSSRASPRAYISFDLVIQSSEPSHMISFGACKEQGGLVPGSKTSQLEYG
uniref:Uncharacterized protein n=1 Tax=Moniliophthora roreri TaxID=221103 RepID=A0A0W0FKS7_MONRR